MSANARAAARDGLIIPLGDRERSLGFLSKLEGTPLYSCTIGSTGTAQIPDISAAGETPEKRRYTAALDAEYLCFGRTLTLDEIPKNPAGPPSPVLITRAGLEYVGATPLIIDSGTEVVPRVPLLSLGGEPGRCLTTGEALTLDDELIARCLSVGRYLASAGRWLILGESVPGGTTTALSLMEGMGVTAEHKVSSSMPGGNHSLKVEVVRKGLKAAALPPDASGLAVAEAVGDPMQPAVALMALAASERVPLVLGGGSQMAAVYALAVRLSKEGFGGELSNIGLATTRWVSDDAHSDLEGLLGAVDPPPASFAAGLDFSNSRILGLRRYEEGLVKEGVGAGAAAFAAFLAGAGHDELVGRIEELFEGLGDG